MATKYLISKGKLERKDNSLNFVNENGNNYIPIENIDEIICLDEISFNTKLIDFLSKNSIVMHLFNHYEGYSGTFYPREKYLSGNLIIKQVECFNESRIEIARAIVSGIGANMHELLYHYYRHETPELKVFLDYLKDEFGKEINKCASVQKIMQIEGKIWSAFYDSTKYFLREDFILNKRVRRPPDNPINALISFGNTILYTKTISQIYQTHLEQSISFLHSPSDSRFSLCLDLSEAFKPIIVFKTIFDCVNNRKINVEKHFEKNLNYCILNKIGKKIFLEALEQRLNSSFDHAILKRKVTYLKAIKYDGYKLVKTIMEGKKFIPFDIKNKF